MGSITLSNIQKSYGAVHVLHDINLAIDEGEFVVFVGPSGCGKSTLLRVIAGLEKVTGGDLKINGTRVNEVSAADRGLAMVFQSYALYPHMTVRQNLAFGLENSGMPKAEIATRIAEAARMLEIDNYMDRRPGQLSGGQRQRVAIGRAIVRRPTAFLLDEPLSNLDAELRVSTRAEIAALHARLKSTMIYVTHDQVEAMTLADKIVVLNAGRVEQVGSPMELYNRPANLFVAGFIGSPQMNFIEAGRIDRTDAATIGIRPEHTTLSRESGEWQGKIVHVEHLGADTIVYLESDKAGLITARLFGEHPYAADEVVFASPDPGKMHRFDAEGRAMGA